MCVFVNMFFLFSCLVKAKLNVFLLSINVGKILLHALSITHHAGKFWLQVKAASLVSAFV